MTILSAPPPRTNVDGMLNGMFDGMVGGMLDGMPDGMFDGTFDGMFDGMFDGVSMECFDAPTVDSRRTDDDPVCVST